MLRHHFSGSSNPQNVSMFFDSRTSIINCSFNDIQEVATYDIHCNDYVACMSIGEHNSDQISALIDHGNSDLDAYVTYDTEKLLQAIRKYLKRSKTITQKSVACVPIRYSKVEMDTEVTTNSTYYIAGNECEMWERASIEKPHVFTHENEARIILYHEKFLGQLPPDRNKMLIKSGAIREAITDHGTIHQ